MRKINKFDKIVVTRNLFGTDRDAGIKIGDIYTVLNTDLDGDHWFLKDDGRWWFLDDSQIERLDLTDWSKRND